MCLDCGENGLGNVRRRLVTAWSKTGPVIEINDFDVATLTHDAITAINHHVELFGGTLTHRLERFHIESDALRTAVHLFPAIFAVPRIKRIEPKEIRTKDT